MSEADHPNHQPFGEPTEPPPSPPLQASDQSVNSPSSTPNEDWETVNFPNAIPIEQFLLDLETNKQQTPSEEVEVQDGSVNIQNWSEEVTSRGVTEGEEIPEDSPLRVVQILHNSNRDLINRVTELEAELEESGQKLQSQETQVIQRTQELVSTQEQVKRLFKKLEIANQVIRQQQVLVETITQQWETAQTRLAQMERDCTLTQQRYHEQFHEAVQLQTMCRELRSRLHRQQRQTLQFKVALERSLETQQLQQAEQPFNTNTIVTSNSEQPSRPNGPVLLNPELFETKARPVQPWSKSLSETPKRTDPIEELIKLEEETIANSEQNSSGVEGLPPLIKTDSQPPEPTSSDVTPPPVSEEVSTTPSNLSFEVTSQEFPQPQFLEDELDRIRLEYAAFISEDADLFLLQPTSQETTSQTQSSNSESAQPELAGVARTRESPEPATNESDWPAPLIYPQRQKKLQSLASIKLPTFPSENPFMSEEF